MRRRAGYSPLGGVNQAGRKNRRYLACSRPRPLVQCGCNREFQRRYQVADAKVVGYLIASEVRITWLLRCRLKLGPKEQTSLKFRFGSEAVVGVPKTASALPSKADVSSDVDADLAERQANVGFWD